MHIDIQVDRHTGMLTNMQAGPHADRQAGMQARREADRHANTSMSMLVPAPVQYIAD